jgi:hypothetical protein
MKNQGYQNILMNFYVRCKGSHYQDFYRNSRIKVILGLLEWFITLKTYKHNNNIAIFSES